MEAGKDHDIADQCNQFRDAAEQTHEYRGGLTFNKIGHLLKLIQKARIIHLHSIRMVHHTKDTQFQQESQFIRDDAVKSEKQAGYKLVQKQAQNDYDGTDCQSEIIRAELQTVNDLA